VTIERAARILVALVAAALLVVAATGAALAWFYDPHWAGSVDALGPDQRLSRSLVAMHELSLRVAVPLALVTIVVLAVARSSIRQVAGMVVALLAAAVASMTWGLVQWNQIALAAVTVGGRTSGLWWPAFDDGVAFILMGGAEIGQETYRVWLLVHLAAPVVGLVALAAAWPARPPTEHVDVDADDVPVFDLT